MKLNRDLAREMCVELYEAYEGTYQSQGAYSSRVHSDRAFGHAIRILEGENFNPLAPCDVRKLARRVAALAKVQLAKAEAVTRAAVHSRRALELAKVSMLEDSQARQTERG